MANRAQSVKIGEITTDFMADDSSLPQPQLKDLFPNHVFAKVFGELESLKGQPRACVVVTHGLVELLINILVEEKCKNATKIVEQTRDFPHAVKLVLLHELGIINDEQFRALSWFRKLRNRAVHEPQFEIRTSDLDIFKTTSFANAEFHVQCMVVVMILWNQNQEIFSRRFFPTLYGDAAGGVSVQVKK
jgi:hypothetical protein